MATGFHPPGLPASAPPVGADGAVAFSAAAAAEIARIRQRYPTALAALIPTLFVAQREFGWLPDEVLELVATTLGVPATKVRSTATFYTMLKKEPTGRVHVQVCKNISCYLRRSDDVTAAWEDELGIACGETTDDGEFTLSEVECLAACGRAPVVQINEEYHEWQTPETTRALAQGLRREAATRGGRS
ncbi:MAG: NAD(P)H-dependent oxidoreductase subunit E [Deltaproteobacteria bacterium]|nr:NAD(P)H-dependent oxidoreductase subunit E [Deltaproteobacteria bacterium]